MRPMIVFRHFGLVNSLLVVMAYCRLMIRQVQNDKKMAIAIMVLIVVCAVTEL